jgi:putative CocE/NonD family hydrolase
MSGWYDYYAGAACRAFNALRAAGESDEIRLVINPSNHVNRIVGDRDFGTDVHKHEIALAIRWLDGVLKGLDTGLRDEPPIRIFVMGANRWRFAHQWPLPGTRFVEYYLHSADGARIGALDTHVPGDELTTRYRYDPQDPVPSLGGNHSADARGNLDHLVRNGPVDQRPNEARDDVLVFRSAPLVADVEVTGPVVVKLYAASSARDTDFIARLIDVYPDGRAYNLTEGIIRARFRESIYLPPALLVPGQVYEYTIQLLPTSNVFKRGHRICVHVTSSGFPLWDRNPNTGHAQGMDAEMRVAEQTVYHGKNHPSHIVLPVVPQGKP